MELLLKRIAKQATYTIGRLYVDGQYFCDTLEDTDRGLTQKMTLDQIKAKKVYSKTAIPTGTYNIDINTVSPTFKNRSWAKPWGGKIPRLENVPGYDGVLIHVGNTSDDTSGCILVGLNTIKGQVTSSTNTFNKLMNTISGKSNITITIE